MNALRLKNLFLANAPLTIISFILGYSFWYIAAYDQTITLQVNIPLYFSGIQNNYKIDAPEQIQVTLRAKRAVLTALDNESLAAHVDISHFLPGIHAIIITEQHLFLPKNINLVHYKPANLAITISEIDD